MNLTLRNYLFIALISLVSLPLAGQEMLDKAEAVKIALENNFDIRTADNNVAIAKNNASVMNSQYLPSVGASAGATFSVTDTEITVRDSVRVTDGAQTQRYNGSVSLNYTIFDGFGRENIYRSLQESYNISELQARQVIETALVNIFAGYYEVARLTENEINQQQTLDISRERLLRAKYGFEYGQSSQLDVLNAEVDYNTDSINYLTIVQELENQKRNLNLLLGRDINIAYGVDTAVSYVQNLEFTVLIEKAKVNNVNILLAHANLRNAEYNIRSTSAARLPSIGLNANYGATFNNLGPTSFADKQQFLGPSVGATLNWNIFDGGATNVRRQNSKINLENQTVALEQAALNLDRNVNNAWNIYQTALFVMEAERTNLRTNQLNFNRTVEQYGLGQITSIEFRQAQINLLNAELNYNRAKYSAKIAELALYQLSGDLMDAEF
jgi:outer membrane protein TolC